MFALQSADSLEQSHEVFRGPSESWADRLAKANDEPASWAAVQVPVLEVAAAFVRMQQVRDQWGE